MRRSLAKIDLNLLRALHVILEERSVTRAAKRLFITQPGMSKSLNRLRELFDDPLLVRGKDGQLLTPRANELAIELEQIFSRVENCFTPTNFDPALAQGRIRIAAPEQFAIFVVPELTVRLSKSAPNLIVDSQPLMDNHQEMLASGSLDFVLFMDKAYPDDFNTKIIYSAPPVFWCRRKHPLVGKKDIDYPDICAYPHIAFNTQNMSRDETLAVKRAIASAGLTTKVILDTSLLLVAMETLVRTDALLLGPNYLYLPFLHDALYSFPVSHLPVFNRNRTNISLIQHRRTLNSPLHRWLADEIANTFLTMVPTPQ